MNIFFFRVILFMVKRNKTITQGNAILQRMNLCGWTFINRKMLCIIPRSCKHRLVIRAFSCMSMSISYQDNASISQCFHDHATIYHKMIFMEIRRTFVIKMEILHAIVNEKIVYYTHTPSIPTTIHMESQCNFLGTSNAWA